MWTTIDSPVGTVRVVAQQDAIVALEFVPDPAPEEPSRSSAALARERATGRPDGRREDDDPLLADAAAQLRAYFDRDLTEFDLPVRLSGSPFQERVWAQLRQVGYGETVAYGQLAQRLGMSVAASRAVGMANGRNPVALVVPCHRVLGAGGKLIGYAHGLERKRRLLEMEQDGLS